MDPNEVLEPATDQPGLYYVTVYQVQPDGTLEDSTTRLSYRALNPENAIARTKHQFPHASIVNVDFHHAIDDFEDDFDPDLFTTQSDDDAL